MTNNMSCVEEAIFGVLRDHVKTTLEAFLTAVMQNFARANHYPIDRIDFDIEARERREKRISLSIKIISIHLSIYLSIYLTISLSLFKTHTHTRICL